MKYPVFILMLMAVFSCYAQSERNDSIIVENTNMRIDLPTTIIDRTSSYYNQPIGHYINSGHISSSLFDPTMPSPIFSSEVIHRSIPIYYPAQVNPGVIFQSKYLSLTGAVDIFEYHSMMNKEVGNLGITVGNERMNLYVGGIVNKYGYYGGLRRQIGINGEFTYKISSPFSFTAFAYYFGKNPMPIMPNGVFMPPSMLGYYDVSKFGGYLNYSATERFGIQMGGQVVERMGTQNHYEAEPMFTPYIVVGRGKKKIGIGLPVGQLLYGIFSK